MGSLVGYCVMYLSALISCLYLAALSFGYGYFAWGVDHQTQRCYALNDKAYTSPLFEDGADRHDVTTDF